MTDTETKPETTVAALTADTDLVRELGEASSELRALATRLTRLKSGVRPVAMTAPKSWLQMETELIRLRERVVSALHKEHWSLRRIGEVLGTGPEAVRQYIGRAEDEARRKRSGMRCWHRARAFFEWACTSVPGWSTSSRWARSAA